MPFSFRMLERANPVRPCAEIPAATAANPPSRTYWAADAEEVVPRGQDFATQGHLYRPLQVHEVPQRRLPEGEQAKLHPVLAQLVSQAGEAPFDGTPRGLLDGGRWPGAVV